MRPRLQLPTRRIAAPARCRRTPLRHPRAQRAPDPRHSHAHCTPPASQHAPRSSRARRADGDGDDGAGERRIDHGKMSILWTISVDSTQYCPTRSRGSARTDGCIRRVSRSTGDTSRYHVSRRSVRCPKTVATVEGGSRRLAAEATATGAESLAALGHLLARCRARKAGAQRRSFRQRTQAS